MFCSIAFFFVAGSSLICETAQINVVWLNQNENDDDETCDEIFRDLKWFLRKTLSQSFLVNLSLKKLSWEPTSNRLLTISNHH